MNQAGQMKTEKWLFRRYLLPLSEKYKVIFLLFLVVNSCSPDFFFYILSFLAVLCYNKTTAKLSDSTVYCDHT